MAKARTYKRNKLGQFMGGGKEAKDQTVSKQVVSYKASIPAVDGVAMRASSKSSGKGTSSKTVAIDASMDIDTSNFKSVKKSS